MGSTQALGYAEGVTMGLIRLEGALTAHLTTNFYPPLPKEYVNPLMIALRNVAEGYETDPVRLSPTPRVLPRAAFMEEGDLYIKSCDLVFICHAEPFVDAVGV